MKKYREITMGMCMCRMDGTSIADFRPFSCRFQSGTEVFGAARNAAV